jgi:hypothetical protein
MSTQQNFDVLVLLGASARTTSATGSAVDLQGYVNPGGRAMKAVLNVGAITTAGPLTVVIQDSDTTTAADFTNATNGAFTVIPVETTTTAHEAIHFTTTKRYVRALATATNGGGHSYGVFVLAEKRVK